MSKDGRYCVAWNPDYDTISLLEFRVPMLPKARVARWPIGALVPKTIDRRRIHIFLLITYAKYAHTCRNFGRRTQRPEGPSWRAGVNGKVGAGTGPYGYQYLYLPGSGGRFQPSATFGW